MATSPRETTRQMVFSMPAAKRSGEAQIEALTGLQVRQQAQLTDGALSVGTAARSVPACRSGGYGAIVWTWSISTVGGGRWPAVTVAGTARALKRRSRLALLITDNEDRAIAAAAIMGLSRQPVAG
jgi:hypothetical protein